MGSVRKQDANGEIPPSDICRRLRFETTASTAPIDDVRHHPAGTRCVATGHPADRPAPTVSHITDGHSVFHITDTCPRLPSLDTRRAGSLATDLTGAVASITIASQSDPVPLAPDPGRDAVWRTPLVLTPC